MSVPIAVIFGAGPGFGAAIARALAPTHALVLLSRSLPGSLPKLKLDNVPYDRLIATTLDTKDSAASFKAAIAQARAKWPDSKIDVGICNPSLQFSHAPFLERSVDDLQLGLDLVTQSWNFSQEMIRAMLPSGGTLIFTGSTMAMRGSANFASQAPGSFARRALSQSLAREFGPQGIHVAHVIVDGVIQTPRVDGMLGQNDEAGKRISTDDMAQVYLDVINQKPSTWTQELDIRPMKEKW